MKSGLVFQIILTLIILLLLIVFYSTYISEKNNKISSVTEDETKSINEVTITDDLSSELSNIEYNSYDSIGNSFYINAEKASVYSEAENKNKVKLENVVSIINLKHKGIINIYSNKAIYEKITHNTLFYDDVRIEYLENVINSKNFDVIFSEEYSKIYNNVVLTNDNTFLYSDIIFIDMKTGDINLKMIDKSKKVRLTTNYEFN